MLGSETYNDEFTVLTVNSLDDYIQKVNSITDKISHELYFRGENNEYAHLIPGIYRDPIVALNNSDYYNQLKMESYTDVRNDESLFDELTHFQHYGAQTRFLDVTSSALVGLFFALDNFQSGNTPYVFMFDSGDKKQNLKAGITHTAMVKGATNFISHNIVTNFLSAMDAESPYGIAYYFERSIELLNPKNNEEIEDYIRSHRKKFLELFSTYVYEGIEYLNNTSKSDDMDIVDSIDEYLNKNYSNLLDNDPITFVYYISYILRETISSSTNYSLYIVNVLFKKRTIRCKNVYGYFKWF